MMRRLSEVIGGLFVIGLVATAAVAQETPDERPAPEAPATIRWNAGTGQSAGFFGQASNRARLGVFLQPGCEIGDGVEGDCATAPVVVSVVEDAPAAAAGIEPGDTLLSLDGVSLRTEAGRREMASLREGVPVRLEVGRPTGRQAFEVTPTARTATAVFRVSGTPWHTTAPAPSSASNVQVYRFQSDDGSVAEFHLTQEPGGKGSSNGFVVFGEDAQGNLRVRVGDPAVEVRTRDGQRVELSELEKHLGRLELRPEAPPDGLPLIEHEVEVRSLDGPDSDQLRGRLILENPPLASRLETVHREALVEARARIDSVVKQQVELARRGELPPGAAAGYAYVVPAPGTPGGVPRAPLPEGLDHRLAGAEFRALTPELADYFAVDEGLLVLRVVPGTPAGRLGLRGGDVVVEVGGQKLPDIMTFRHLVAESQASSRPLEVKWNRKGQELEGKLTSR